MPEIKRLSGLDELIHIFDMGLRALVKNNAGARENPAAAVKQPKLPAKDAKHSEGLMRVNHTGEVCAQALYQGQALLCRDKKTKAQLLQAATEEYDHLKWCEQRLNELNGRTSYLNPLWYLGSLTMGVAAGALGPQYSLGFLVETEKQVEAHLSDHLKKLPKADVKSQAILKQMREEEVSHAQHALDSGAKLLPKPVKKAMRFVSKIMTTGAYWI